MQLVKLRSVGGNLVVTIPRPLVRELALVKRQYLTIERHGMTRLLLRQIGERLDDTRRRSARPDRLRR